jgi:hypothetical protein
MASAKARVAGVSPPFARARSSASPVMSARRAVSTAWGDRGMRRSVDEEGFSCTVPDVASGAEEPVLRFWLDADRPLEFPLTLPSRPANRSGSRSASICARQPRGQQPCRFVRGPSVEWHERASGSGDPHDVGSPAVWRNRRNLDDIRPSRDGFFEAMHDVGHQS